MEEAVPSDPAVSEYAAVNRSILTSSACMLISNKCALRSTYGIAMPGRCPVRALMTDPSLYRWNGDWGPTNASCSSLKTFSSSTHPGSSPAQLFGTNSVTVLLSPLFSSQRKKKKNGLVFSKPDRTLSPGDSETYTISPVSPTDLTAKAINGMARLVTVKGHWFISADCSHMMRTSCHHGLTVPIIADLKHV